MKGPFLVTGGAGYVGSHTVLHLLAQGARVVVLDDLSQGHIAAVPSGAELVIGNAGNAALLDEIFSRTKFEAVFHFASLSLVGESMQRPFLYLEKNGIVALRVIEAACRHGVKRFVLSSTANLFGNPKKIPIQEDEIIDPGSPYGESKYFIERALVWAERVHGLRSVSLRYFNACGADIEGRLGEDHDPETHLIPRMIDAAMERRAPVTIFGTDYDTMDGTCIRDYVHVADLAAAHGAVLDVMDKGSAVFNVGSGKGQSVRQVMAAVERVVGRPMTVTYGDRRPGDPAVLIAASDRLTRATGWQARFGDLDAIVGSAYRWRAAHPDGYGTTQF
jgi:UDP-glucose 4-epimerase